MSEHTIDARVGEEDKKVTYIKIVTPDGSLVALSRAVGSSGDVDLRDQSVNTKSGKARESGFQSSFGDKVAGRDVALEADGETRVGNGSARLDVLEDVDHASSLRVIAT